MKMQQMAGKWKCRAIGRNNNSQTNVSKESIFIIRPKLSIIPLVLLQCSRPALTVLLRHCRLASLSTHGTFRGLDVTDRQVRVC